MRKYDELTSDDAYEEGQMTEFTNKDTGLMFYTHFDDPDTAEVILEDEDFDIHEACETSFHYAKERDENEVFESKFVGRWSNVNWEEIVEELAQLL